LYSTIKSEDTATVNW